MRLPLIESEPNGIKRILWLLLGLTFVGVGMIGIVIPGLPTTIFMILAVGCFYRSSQRLYDWVINHKYFGEHVKNYLEGRGMPRKAKLNSFILIWFFVIFSVLFGIPDNMIIFKIITIIAALTGTGFIISLRTI
tara:strand:+ start:2200 stop:2601 length:402 start_codon:yes stop_codon:yes gene_type:complete